MLRGFILFLLIFIGVGVLWYLAGGPQRSLSREGTFLNYVASQGGYVAYPVPQITLNGQTPSKNERLTASNDFGSYTNAWGTFTEKASPYAAFVTLERARADSEYQDEYLKIRISSGAQNPLVITGWKLESTVTNSRIALPRAAQLPFVGTANTEGTVSVLPNSTVYVVTGRSPVGTSFRTNICTGYFEQFQDFTPALPIECPRGSTEIESVLPPADQNELCDKTVRAIPRCTLTLTALPGAIGNACQNFVQQTLSYSGCISAHRNDPEFYRNDWYLYLGRDQELWKQRGERIRLLDEHDLTVGVVQY